MKKLRINVLEDSRIKELLLKDSKYMISNSSSLSDILTYQMYTPEITSRTEDYLWQVRNFIKFKWNRGLQKLILVKEVDGILYQISSHPHQYYIFLAKDKKEVFTIGKYNRQIKVLYLIPVKT